MISTPSVRLLRDNIIGKEESIIVATFDYIHWTECTDNSIHQILASGQVASLHVLQKSCEDSQAR